MLGNLARAAAVSIFVTLLVASCGGGGGGPDGSSSTPPPAATLSMFVGISGGQGYFDATGSSAKFWYPQGIAVDSTGTLYVSDTGNRVIRKTSPQGLVTTFVGTAGQGGLVDGVGSAARFGLAGTSVYGPRGLAVDAQDNVYVAATYNHSIRMITPAGVVTTHAGH